MLLEGSICLRDRDFDRKGMTKLFPTFVRCVRCYSSLPFLFPIPFVICCQCLISKLVWIQEDLKLKSGKGGGSRTKSSGRRKDAKAEGESDSSSEKVSFAGERKKTVTSVKKLKKRRGIPVAPPKLPSSDSVVPPPSLFLTSGLRNKQPNHSSDSGTLNAVLNFRLRTNVLSCLTGAEDELEHLASQRDAITRQLGLILKNKSASEVAEPLSKKEKKKTKEEEKMEKRRIKEEERLKRLTEKKKKKQKSSPELSDFIQSPHNLVPLFLQKSIDFIEAEGLDAEGIYRVPGNRAHVDLLFQKFDEGLFSTQLKFASP